VLIRADGAARGNPGPAAAGAVIIDGSLPDAADPDAEPVAVIARQLGIQTNNFAEYMGVILALEKALAIQAQAMDRRTKGKGSGDDVTSEFVLMHFLPKGKG